MADKTANLGLTLTPRDATTKSFQEFRMELAGTESSNMIILDTEIAALKTLLAGYKGGVVTWGMLKNGFGAAQAADTE